MEITKNLLITQNNLSNYTGSEIVTLEIVNEALRRGFTVTVRTNYYGEPLSELFNKSVKIIGPDEPVDIRKYSHVWIHHNLIPIELIDQLKREDTDLPKIAFHHMSPYVAIESPMLFEFESIIATDIYFNSPETEDAYRDMFNNGHGAKLGVLGNPAPDDFSATIKTPPTGLSKVLVVSNHPPQELIDALNILKTENKISKFDIFGESGVPTLVTPSEMDKYDLIVSIGKTVQYCLVGNRPVYVYDHFGGSGYLSKSNFDKNRYYNFSGRGFKKKSSSNLAKDISSGFVKGVNQLKYLHTRYGNDFMLSRALDKYFEPDKKTINTPSWINSELIRSDAVVKYIFSSNRAINHLLQENNALKTDINYIQSLNDKLTQTNTELEQTISRKIKRILKDIKNQAGNH